MLDTALARLQRFEPTFRMWVLWVLIYSVYSTLMPREHGYDVGHYYIQTGWAALNDRFATDLAASEMHSFLNPVWNAGLWFLIDTLPGRAVAFILGSLQALGLPALYYFTKRLLLRVSGQADPLIVLGASVLGYISAIQALYTGSLVTDGFYATVMIGTFALVMPIRDNTPSLKVLAIASGLIGLSVGLKLTNVLYALYFAVFVLILMPDWPSRIKGGAICAVTGLAAILLTGGYWAWLLYQEFGNPVFPYYNQIFLSPQGPEGGFRDPRFLPNSSLEVLWRPFLFLLDERMNLARPFYDPRFVFTYVAMFAGLFAVWRYARDRSTHANRTLLALSVSSIVTYFIWALMFSIERYLTVFWLIGPSISLAVALFVFPNLFRISAGRIGLLASAVILVLVTSAPDVRRVQWQGWSEPYVYAEIVDPEKYDGAIVAFTGDYPTSFLAPFLPETATFTSLVSPEWSRPALDNYRPRIYDLIRSTDRPLYVALIDLQDNFDLTVQRILDVETVEVETELCERVETSFNRENEVWYLCPARVLAASSAENTS
ncbi:MAG: hypothetical protein AAGK66_01715 [Pseudomonadota bacterium]